MMPFVKCELQNIVFNTDTNLMQQRWLPFPLPMCWINSNLKCKSQAETEWLKYLKCKKYRWTGTCRNNETTTSCILLPPDIRLTSLMLFNQDNWAKWKGHAWKETAAGVSRAFLSTSGELHLIKALRLTHKHQHWRPVCPCISIW